jgi:glycosyltransferase involved in cell wall biosynthesis
MDKPKIHIVSSCYEPVNLHNRVDAFSAIVAKFIKYMTIMGWKCIYYGVEGSSVDCEWVNCNSEIKTLKQENESIYNTNCIKEISDRAAPGDFLACFYGSDNKPIADALPNLIVVEPSIGYDVNAVFAPYRSFCSYAQLHAYYGLSRQHNNPSWFDAVIPNAITPEEFEYTEVKKDYILAFGRVQYCKGVDLAIEACKSAGQQLIIAGPGTLNDLGYKNLPSHVSFVGICGVEERKLLMKEAKAIIGLSRYCEPFGNMVAEGYMCGTPAITTDWGAFSETVLPEVTGFRCREFRDIVNAIYNVEKLKPRDCYNWGVQNYSDKVVHRKFNNYFNKLVDMNFYRN